MWAANSKLKKLQKVFLWIFVVSLGLLAFSIASDDIWHVVSIQEPVDKGPVNVDVTKPQRKVSETSLFSGVSLSIIISAISLLTSLTALLGFFSTTVIAWRKEKREERHSALELEKKELEIRKLKTELKNERGNDV